MWIFLHFVVSVLGEQGVLVLSFCPYLFMLCVGWGWIGDSRKRKEGTTKLLSP